MNSTWRNNETFLHTLLVLFFGQVVSFMVGVMNFTASLLSSLGVHLPLTLSFFTYLTTALVYGSIFVYRRQKLLVSWYWYAILGFIDVQGNFLVNKSYQFSSSNTNVTILNCCTIAWAMILTRVFLGTRYSLLQLLGAVICVMGLSLVFLSDAGAESRGASRPLLGDALIIGGTLFYAMSNVSEEFCVKRKDQVEVVSMIALSGLAVSVCQIYVLEKNSIESVQWSAGIILCFAGYALSSFTLFSLVPFVLKMGGSTMYSLSVLTSNLWAVVIRVFFYHQQVGWLYYLSFASVVVGLIIYCKNSENDPAPEGSSDKEIVDPLLCEEGATTMNNNLSS